MIDLRELMQNLDDLSITETNSTPDMLSEVLSGFKSHLVDTLKSKLPGEKAKGEADILSRANVMLKNWYKTIGRTGILSNKTNLLAWFKAEVLASENTQRKEEVLNQTVSEFIEKFPNLKAKFDKNQELERFEILNLLKTFIRVIFYYEALTTDDVGLDIPTAAKMIIAGAGRGDSEEDEALRDFYDKHKKQIDIIITKNRQAKKRIDAATQAPNDASDEISNFEKSLKR